MNVRAFLFWAPALVLAGCASTSDRVVLLPSPEGKVGKIAVFHDGSETLLNSAYNRVQVDSNGQVKKDSANAESVRKPFTQTLAAMPQRPASYMLYFLEDSDELTPESREQAKVILTQIAKRPAGEIVVIGHTDRVGAVEYNDALSLARAAAMRNQLVKLGANPELLSTAGRGERELLVPTEDEMSEPRNRRVEINVR